jgi:cyclopropane fatty-acyl-phospholipid synthase-like methyltransferase
VSDRRYERWDEVYRQGGEGPYPWDLGRPRDFLVELVEKGMIRGRRALDTCCGLGTNGLYLAEQGFEVTGIDISGKAVEIASRRAEEAGRAGSIQLHTRNFMDMGFQPEAFDFVLDVGCFHHVSTEDRLSFIANVHRVLIPGGRYLLMCFSDRMGPSWNHFSEEAIRNLFSNHFRILTHREISSVEGDGATRYFHVALMEKRSSE